MEETWKYILGTNEQYSVSSKGRIKRNFLNKNGSILRKEFILKNSKNANGYLTVWYGKIHMNSERCILKIFGGLREASRELGIPLSSLSSSIKMNKIYKNNFYQYGPTK